MDLFHACTAAVTHLMRRRHPLTLGFGVCMLESASILCNVWIAHYIQDRSRAQPFLLTPKIFGPGLNALWHIDSHHSICWHVVVHCCIDGYKYDTVVESFVPATTEFGLPSCFRSDRGRENVGVCRYMFQRRGTGQHSHITGKSTHDQRIECLWRDMFHCVSATFYILHGGSRRFESIE